MQTHPGREDYVVNSFHVLHLPQRTNRMNVGGNSEANTCSESHHLMHLEQLGYTQMLLPFYNEYWLI